MTRQACVDCHFFVKSYRDSQPAMTSLVTADKRAAVRERDFAWHDDRQAPVALACDMKVWDEGLAGFPRDKRYALLVEQERKGNCFFRRYEPGMLLPAARELQTREMEADRWRKERRLTLVGLWIAALALLASLAIDIAGLLSQFREYGPEKRTKPVGPVRISKHETT